MGKFKSLTLRQKIGYIRDYYTIHIIVAIVAVAAVGWTLNHYIFNPPPRTFINISFYGQFVSEGLRITLAENLTNSLVEEDANYIVVVENFFTSGDMQFDMAMSQRMVAMASARELDILIIAPGAADNFLEAGFAQDLSNMLSMDEMAQLSNIAYFPYFSNLATQFSGDFDGWTMIVMSNSGRDVAVRSFLDYTLLFFD